MDQAHLNAVYSSLRMKRRYEVWFLRCGLADGSGAWWFRYLVMNPGIPRNGLAANEMPAQVWATWFPRGGAPRTFIQGFPREQLQCSPRQQTPFHCRIAESGIEQEVCWGKIQVDGQQVSWKLALHSTFGTELSNKGWIGFSRSPHSDACFSGEIEFDGRKFTGQPLGFGVQGHNCGYRHRSYWRWMHAYFPATAGATTLEALVYDLPLGFTFRKVVLWHAGKMTRFSKVSEGQVTRSEDRLKWEFTAVSDGNSKVELSIEGARPELHQLPYVKTDGSGAFPVSNASLATAVLRLSNRERLETRGGAVLEMGGT